MEYVGIAIGAGLCGVLLVVHIAGFVKAAKGKPRTRTDTIRLVKELLQLILYFGLVLVLVGALLRSLG